MVLDAERVGESLQLRHALLERHLAAFEAAGDLAAGAAGPWCRDRRSCRPCRRCRGRRAWRFFVAPGAGERSWTCMVSRLLWLGIVLADINKVRHAAIMPRISGRSGKVFVLPIRPRPRARSVPRVFGLAVRTRLDLGDGDHLLAHESLTRASFRRRAASAARCRPATCPSARTLGRQAAPLGDLVGALQRLEPGDRGAGDVDVVGRAERLAEHVVDAGLLEDDAGGAAGDHAGTGRSRLHQHATATGLAGDRVGDRRAGERHVEQVALGLFGALLDRQRHLLGLAVAEADATVAVTDDHERREREAAAALDDLGDAVDRDHPRLAQAAAVGLARGGTLVVCCWYAIRNPDLRCGRRRRPRRRDRGRRSHRGRTRRR